MIGFVMMALGAYRFAVATGGFTELSRQSSWRWASQDVIGATPTLQFIGPGSDTLSIGGTIFPAFANGLGLRQVDQMRAEAGAGSPKILVDGTGRYWGDWVVESIDETQTTFFADGAPRKVEFRLQLRKHA